jgi:hypothetical protein
LFAPPQVRHALAQFVQREKAFLISGEQAIDALADANEIAAESLLTAFWSGRLLAPLPAVGRVRYG